MLNGMKSRLSRINRGYLSGKKIALILLMLLFVTFSFAHDENVPHYVNMENPAGLVNPDGFFEYIIIKGDCLWFIADEFYNDPFKWTKIHKANPYIIDPDWIYPNNWLVIPHVYADDSGKPIYSPDDSIPGKTTWVEESETWSETTKTWSDSGEKGVIISDKTEMLVVVDNEGNVIYDNDGNVEGVGVDSDGDGVVDGYDTNSDGQIDVTAGETVTLNEYNATKAKADAKTKAEAKAAKEAALAAAESDLKDTEKVEYDKSSVESYCGKPGWKLGLHAGYPVGGGPEDENLNLGLLLGTPLGVKVGPISVGLGAGAFTYDFDNYYIGGGLLASLCINDLLKLDMPLILQLHGVGFYVFGEDQGLGFGAIGSGSVPLGKTPLSLGLYGALGKYYPNDNDYNWSNVGAVLFYSL